MKIADNIFEIKKISTYIFILTVIELIKTILAAHSKLRPRGKKIVFNKRMVCGKLDLFWFPIFGNSMWCNDDRPKWADGCQNGPS